MIGLTSYADRFPGSSLSIPVKCIHCVSSLFRSCSAVIAGFTLASSSSFLVHASKGINAGKAVKEVMSQVVRLLHDSILLVAAPEKCLAQFEARSFV